MGLYSREQFFATLLLLVPILAVFDQDRWIFLGWPWYVPELLTLGALLCVLLCRISMKAVFPRRDIFFWALLFLLVGLSGAALLNDIPLHGYGRLKSWFFFPLLYGTLLSFAIRKEYIRRRELLLSLFLGGVLVGISVCLSLFQGGAFTYDHRLRGEFPSPNHLALLLGAALIAGVSLSASAWRDGSKEGFVIALGSCFLLFLLLLTQSYAVLLTLVALFSLIGIRYRAIISRKWLFIFLSVGLLLMGFLFFVSENKWQSVVMMSDRSSISSRGMIWQSAWKMIGDNPILGIGPGNFQREYLEYQRYFPPYLEWSAPHPHNMFLDIWLEGGILGCIGLLILFFFWIGRSARLFCQKKKRSDLSVAPLLFALYFFSVGLVDVPFLRNDLAYSLSIALVFSLSLMRDESDRSFRHGDS